MECHSAWSRRLPGPQRGSRGKGLQPRTLEVFDDLGIGERVIAHGRMAMPIRSIGLDGEVTLGGTEPEALKDRPDIPYTTSLITPEWRTEEALRLRLADLGGVVEFGTVLERFEQSDETVSAVLASGGETETVTAQWLIGCDGGHSVVRAQAGVAFAGETREELRMIVADLGVDGLDRDVWHMWRHPDGLLALCPLPSTSVFQYQALIPPGQDPALSLANMQAILEQRTGRSDIRLHEPEWLSLWRANIRLVDRYRVGRVFLAGDAAHIHSPAGGQGMNTGIQDAYNLGWKLAAVTAARPRRCLTLTRPSGGRSPPACSPCRTRASRRRSTTRNSAAMPAPSSSAWATAAPSWRATTATKPPCSALATARPTRPG